MTYDDTAAFPEPGPGQDPGQDSGGRSRRTPRPVRAGTVVWGFILIGIAAIFFAVSQFDVQGLDPLVAVVWIVLGIGVLAVLGGIAGAVFRRRR